MINLIKKLFADKKDKIKDERWLKKKFKKLEPWSSKFIINGKEYGGTTEYPSDVRIDYFWQKFDGAKTILELGALEGGHTVRLCQNPKVEKIIAIESRTESIKRARFIKNLLSLAKVEFIKGNLETFDLPSLGRFDAVFCSGLLYHLPKPWELMAKLSQITNNIFIDTHYASKEHTTVEKNGLIGYLYPETPSHVWSGMSSYSFWPTFESLQKMISQSGFEKMEVMYNNYDHLNGPRTFIAARK
ncbi:MAG: class I SAM-dependent methyltransferase [Patescibacteria group bacterium]